MTPPTAPASALPDRPSIAVLPFTNMSDDAEQDYFCDGLVEDIITTLSKLARLRVIARNSSFVYKGRLILLMQKRYDEAVADTRKAVQLAPDWPMQRNLPASFSRRRDIPKKQSYRARKRSPSARTIRSVLGTLGNAYRLSGRTEQAIAAFNAYHARNPGFGLIDIVIAYREIGQPEEARRTAERLMTARPNFTIAGWLKTQFIRRDAARVEADTAALCAAGLPMG